MSPNRLRRIRTHAPGCTSCSPAEVVRFARGMLERLLDLGADGIMSDRVAALKDLFKRRGVWR